MDPERLGEIGVECRAIGGDGRLQHRVTGTSAPLTAFRTGWRHARAVVKTHPLAVITPDLAREDMARDLATVAAHDIRRNPGDLGDAGNQRIGGGRLPLQTGQTHQIVREGEALGLRYAATGRSRIVGCGGGGVGGQDERGGEKIAFCLMQGRDVERRRDQDEALDDYVEIVRQGLRHRRRPEAAIALADQPDWRSPALMPGQPQADHRAQGGDVGAHIPKRFVWIFLLALAAAETGADRVDKDQIGKDQPGRRVINEVDGRGRHGSAFRRLQDLRAERAEMQKDRGRTGTPIEDEADRPGAAILAICEIADREDRCGDVALGIGHRQGLGDRLVVEPALVHPRGVQTHRMMGRDPRRQLAIWLLIRPRIGRSEGGQEQQKYDRQRFRHRPPRILPGPRPGRSSTGDLRTVSILWDRGGKLYYHCRIFRGGSDAEFRPRCADHRPRQAGRYRQLDCPRTRRRRRDRSGRTASSTLGDVSVEADAGRMVEEVLSRYARLDILVNNAGAPQGADRNEIEDVPVEAWDRTMGVNARGAFLMSRAAVPAMRQAQWGRMFSASSRAAFRPGKHRAAYAASKAAIVGFTKSLAFDLAPFGITVNAVCPGPIRTSRAISTSRREYGDDLEVGFRERAKAIPVGRFGSPDEVAAMIAFLASDQAAFVTGQAIGIEGGGGGGL